MESLSEADLDAIQKRAHDATPGPWWAWVEGRDGIADDTFVGRGSRDARHSDLYLSHDGPGPVTTADIDFIASACQDIPRLIAGVRRLRGQITGA
jgi:hypothetical protein